MGNALLPAAMKDHDIVILADAIIPFDNLQLCEIEAFWRAFYDSATSFALSKNQLRSICCRADALGVSCLQVSKVRIGEYADSVFNLLTDSNTQKQWQQVQSGGRGPHSHQYQGPSDNLSAIDALEFLSAIALIAAISINEKIDLLFDSWDMSEDGVLDLDEFTISLKSTLSGLAKILQPTSKSIVTHSDAAVDEAEIVMLAELIFQEIADCNTTLSKGEQGSSTITCDQFREFCLKDMRAKELLELFDVVGSRFKGQVVGLEEEETSLGLKTKLEKHFEVTEPSNSNSTADADVGDMFLAVKPWMGAIVAPTKLPPLSKGAPLVSIKLDWIFGYSAQDCKNNVRYITTTAAVKAGHFDEILYPAAATCVILNTKSMKQRHHLFHTDDVLSLCLHPRLPLAASGEIGKQPKTIVWDLNTMEVQCIIKGYHKRGVLQLAFPSPDLLISIGGDDDHSLAVYESSNNWKSAALKIAVRGNKSDPFHITTNPREPSEFVICGQKYVEFWFLEGKELLSKKGLLGTKGILQPFPVAQYLEKVDQTVAVGTSDGCLYLFVKRQLTNIVKAHDGAITTLFYSSGLLLSSGRDGHIIQWDDKLKQVGSVFRIQDSLESSALPQRKRIRSCCFSPDRRSILVGTLASEIYELDAKTGQNIHTEALTKGHFQGELWGLDTHPTKQQMCTVGDDQTLRIWDLMQMYEMQSLELPMPGRACAYSGDGKLIAVGLGNGDSGKINNRSRSANAIHRKLSGGFAVYSGMGLNCVKEPTFDAKRWVSDVKFSPDNRILAVASHDSKIYLYSVLRGFSRTHIFSKHSSAVMHIDFSLNGDYLQSTSGGYELLFTEVKSGKHIPNATMFRDEVWHTMTSVLGWSVQGIWESESDGTDINAVDRSNDGKLLVSGDDFGKVKVFHFPCVSEKASYLELRGHSSHVTNVRWSTDDSYIVSVGGNDRCIFVWKHDIQPSRTNNVFEFRPIATSEVGDRTKFSIKRVDDSFEEVAMNDDIGDEFMAVRPWLGAVVAPTKAALMKVDSTSPNARLELERVHGYQAQMASNNARYDSTGKVVYHAAALGIIYDKGTQRQSFFKSHDDDIVALSAHPNGTMFATSQVGKKPKIYVWDSLTGDVVGPCLEGFHQRFVNAICFSSDGLKLGSVGGDDDHSIAIYNWQSGLLTSQSRGERNSVRSMCYHAATKEWVTCGEKHIRFWTEQGTTLTSKKALFGTKKHQNGNVSLIFDCVVSFGHLLVAGGSSGHLIIFQNSLIVTKTVQAHDSAVFALYATERELISGGKDSKIAIWDAQVNKVAMFDLKIYTLQGIKLLNSGIRSICSRRVSPRFFLIGTVGSDLLEFDAGQAQPTLVPVTRGHCKMEVWGVACHPTKAEYCTVGDDQTIRVWCLVKKVQLRIQRLECVARACALADSTNIVAIGYGGRNAVTGMSRAAQSKTGGVVLLSYSDLTRKVFEDRPSKQAISEMKFSPNGLVFAVGSHDHKIYIYRLDCSGSKVVKTATFDKHQSYITHFDFSADSHFLQSNCGAYELLFCNAKTGKHITSASSTRDTPWHSWTCVLGWPVQGIWPPFSDGTDVNAVARNSRENLLVTSDDFGLVKLYRYPCVEKNATSVDYRGHSSYVTNVRWSHNDDYVISIGGNDRTIMEWRVLSENESDPAANEPEKRSSRMEIDNPTDSSAESEEELFNDSVGDEFMAVKPWIGAIVAPTNATTPNAREPDLHVELEWVYGYQSELSSQNLVYNAQDEIVYHTAAVGIIYDSKHHLQRHHIGHNDDIMSFAICNTKRSLIATGERGRKPVVRIWNAHTGELRCELKGFHARGILSLAFSSDSTRLVSVGDDDDHSVAVYSDASNGSWTLAKLLATGKGTKALNYFASFGSNADTFVTGGAKHVLFWSVQGKTVVSKQGIVGKKGNLQTFLTGCIFVGDFVTGTVGGDLYVWKGHNLLRVVKAHEEDVRVVASNAITDSSGVKESSVLLSGGKDGRVVMWNSAYQSLKCFDLGSMPFVTFCKIINSVCLNSSGRKLLVGTCSSDIIEIDVASGGALNGGQPLFSGHFAMELWGLAVHPSQRQFVTTGDDRTLRIWNMETKRLIIKRLLSTKARACAYSPDAELVAVGFGGDNGIRQRRKASSKQGHTQSKEGGFAVYRTNELHAEKPVFQDKPAKEWISDVKFSPNGEILALGSHDNSIYFYSVGIRASDFQKRTPFHKHNSFITHFDFSRDSKHIQSNCGAYENLFCETTSSTQVSRVSSMRDVKWATWTCTLGWPVQGIWPDYADGTDINAVCASSSRTILAAGDDSGNVKLFRYPCTLKGSKFIACRGHSSHVANVRFSFDDKYLISVGGNDRSIFQWKLT